MTLEPILGDWLSSIEIRAFEAWMTSLLSTTGFKASLPAAPSFEGMLEGYSGGGLALP
jgi:hypothetical protein